MKNKIFKQEEEPEFVAEDEVDVSDLSDIEVWFLLLPFYLFVFHMLWWSICNFPWMWKHCQAHRQGE